MKPYFADSSLHLNGLTGLTGILQVCVPKRERGNRKRSTGKAIQWDERKDEC